MGRSRYAQTTSTTSTEFGSDIARPHGRNRR